MREFGAVGERELHGCACGNVQFGHGNRAVFAHVSDSHGVGYHDLRSVLRNGEVGAVVAFVLHACLVLADERAPGRVAKPVALDRHRSAVIDHVMFGFVSA